MIKHPDKTTNQHMIQHNVEALSKWIEGFLRDCRVRDLSPFTIEYYRAQLAAFETFARAHNVIQVPEISADLIRSYLLELEATGHNPGGRHAKYRAVRAFLLWWQREAEPEDWVNPLAKVKPPKVTQEPIDGAKIADIKAILTTCGDDWTGTRDKAIILSLLDTGARAREFLALNLDDVDSVSGSVILHQTKNRKPRTVFLGKRSRKALRAFLKRRTDNKPALWVTSTGERLAMSSLQGMLKRRGKQAAIHPPSPHDFRRGFALAMLRAGVDVITLARLMGHSSLEILTRYIKQNTEDLRAAHDRAGIVDKLFS
jgi:site-specific recombinase XerD